MNVTGGLLARFTRISPDAGNMLINILLFERQQLTVQLLALNPVHHFRSDPH